MPKALISTGSLPNDGSGDTLRTAGQKINSNFNEIYNSLGNGSVLAPVLWENGVLGITTTSDVGIGTTSPSQKFEVQNGNIKVGVNTSNGLILTDSDGVPWKLFVPAVLNLKPLLLLDAPLLIAILTEPLPLFAIISPFAVTLPAKVVDPP